MEALSSEGLLRAPPSYRRSPGGLLAPPSPSSPSWSAGGGGRSSPPRLARHSTGGQVPCAHLLPQRGRGGGWALPGDAAAGFWL